MPLIDSSGEEVSVVLQRTHHRIEITCVSVALVVIISAAILFTVTNNVIRSNARQSVMLRLVSDWERLVYQVKEAESDQRDYLLSGTAEDLHAYRAAADRVTPLLDRIAAAEDDLNVVAQVRQLTEKRMAMLQAAIDRRRDDGEEVIEALARKGEGAGAMSSLRSLTEKMHARREEGVAREMTSQDGSALMLGKVFILLAGANLLFLGWAYGRINHAIEARDLALTMRYGRPGVSPETG